MTGTDYSPLGSAEPGQGFVKKDGATKASGGVFAAGDLLARDTATAPDGWKIAPSTAVKPFAVAMEAYASGTTTLAIGLRGIFNMTMEGACEVGNYVMPASTRPGFVKVWDAVAETTKVGRYLGHRGENDATNIATAAADGDQVLILVEAD